MHVKSIPPLIVVLALASSADAQIVSGVMGVTGAEMH